MTATVVSGTAPGAVPLVGHMLRLARNPLRFIASLPAHGDLVEIKLGPWRAVVVCHPDLVHQVLLDDRTFDRDGRFFDKVRQVVGDGLATCPHREHRRQRRMLQPAFHRDRFPTYAAVMAEQITTVIESWRDGQVLDLVPQMYAITSTVTAKTMFTDHLGTSGTTVFQALDTVMKGVYWRTVSPLSVLEKLPTPGNRRYHQARAHLRQIVDRIIANYRRDGVDRGDLLSMLLAARDDDGQALTDTEIYNQVSLFFLAGTETTATALAWALHLISVHPEIEERLYAEVDAVLAGRTASYDDLPQLELTGRILTETLRFYPPGWLFTRATSVDTVLAGHPLPVGSIVMYSPYLIHHRADVYPDPERFDPDRWLHQPANQLPPGAFIPFAAGAHKCIGATFAMTEATLALASIAARWRLQPTSDVPVRPVSRANLTPESLHMRLHRRKTTPPLNLEELS